MSVFQRCTPVSNYPGFLVIFFYLEFDSLQRSNESEGRSAERKNNGAFSNRERS